MLAVEVVLLARRYTATAFNDRDQPEWPPHPARLFSALVAAWADAEQPSDPERQALEWLEQLGAPTIECDPQEAVALRSVVTHYVPVNDRGSFDAGESSWNQLVAAEAAFSASAEGDGRARRRAESQLASALAKVRATSPDSKVRVDAPQAMPDLRPRQGRTYPTVVPSFPAVCFRWPSAVADPGLVEALDGVLARVGRLGHSSTLVSCRVVRTAEGEGDRAPTYVPAARGATPKGVALDVRVPTPGSLRALEAEYLRHQGRAARSLPSAMATYLRAGVAPPALPSPLLGGPWMVLRFLDGRSVGITRVLDLARAVRAALLAHAGEPIAPVLSGHVAGPPPTRPLTEPHLAVVPLASIGHVESDGAVLGVGLVLPRDLAPGDEEALAEAVAAWAAAGLALTLRGHEGAPFALSVVDAFEQVPATLRREWWTRPAADWASVTPVALDRFPGDLHARDSGRAERAVEEAEQSVRRACVHAGLPEPELVDVSTEPFIGTVPAVRRGRTPGRRASFPMYRTGSSNQPRVCVHARIRFPVEVAGPVLVGAGRYLGYGLFLPRRGGVA